jgi:hypothetical protein
MSPIILTGMHRSGTSAIARLTQGLGLNLGSNLLPATVNNLHGHFEDMAFIRFHDKLIARVFPERAPFCEWLPLADAATSWTDEDQDEACDLWETHQKAGGAAWKDPRTSLFLDLWTSVLPDAKVIVCLRHPYQVHLSLLRRGEPFLHADYAASLRGWTIYNRRILQALAKLPRDCFAVVDVEKAFREPRELGQRLAEFLGKPSPDASFAMISPGEFHFEEDLAGALEHFADYFPEVHDTFLALKRLDLLHPEAARSAPPVRDSTILSNEARLIEFEERHGLRKKTKRMLIRSIAADRKRASDFNRLTAEAEAEKDKLIEDLSRFNEQLKREILRSRESAA